jgi:hypothetical protein
MLDKWCFVGLACVLIACQSPPTQSAEPLPFIPGRAGRGSQVYEIPNAMGIDDTTVRDFAVRRDDFKQSAFFESRLGPPTRHA